MTAAPWLCEICNAVWPCVPMPPGPAFIPVPHDWRYWPLSKMDEWYHLNVPADYHWQDATPHSPAGWVRPTGEAR